jgi:hypothetical protein
MEPSDFAKKQKVLSELFAQCDRHKGKDNLKCWKPLEPPFHGKTCIRMSSHYIYSWAQAWSSGTCTEFTNPNTEEFWKLKEQYTTGNRHRGVRSITPDIASQNPVQFQLFFDKQQNPVINSNSRLNTSPSRTRSHSLEGTITSIKGFHPKEYNGAGLLAFLKSCRDFYGDDAYLDVYPSLREEMLGIDLFYKAMLSTTRATVLLIDLKTEAKIKSGMAQRLLTDFPIWFGDGTEET